MKNGLPYIAFLLLVSCGTPTVEPQPAPSGEEGASAPTELAGFPYMGLVSCNGKPVAGAVLTDGVNVTATNMDGHYWLQGVPQGSGRQTDFIILSVPPGYRLVSPENAWARPQSGSSKVQRFDFILTPEDQSSYSLMVFADMHLSGRNPSRESFSISTLGLDFDQFKDYNNYIGTYASSIDEPVYGVNLGDMTQQQYWSSGSFKDYIEAFRPGFPVYNVIGNHDHDHKEKTDYAATRKYRESLGPTYYSFNIGTQHYIALDNMVFENAANTDDYKATIDDIQLSWLEKDIAAAPKETTDFVILCHVPFATLQSSGEGTATTLSSKKWLSNMSTVLALFSGRKLSIFSGHQHWKLSYSIQDNVMQYCHNSVCGSWWYTPLCNDGTPAAFEHYKFHGEQMRHSFLPLAKEYRSLRYRVYPEGITSQSGYLRPTDTGYENHSAEDDRSSYPAAVNINLFEYEPGWTVTVTEDGKESLCYPVPRTDFEHRNLCDNGTVPYKKYSWLKSSRTLHTLQYVPSKTGARLSFRISDQEGRPKYAISNIVVK